MFESYHSAAILKNKIQIKLKNVPTNLINNNVKKRDLRASKNYLFTTKQKAGCENTKKIILLENKISIIEVII